MLLTGSSTTSVWAAVGYPALAGALGWGIRGQYGHETGAMIAGVLVALVLALQFCPAGDSARVARAVAWGTVAMGIGGSMTYGQTIGLTQDAPLIGNWTALTWGLLGLAIKGAVWVGFAGAFLGLGLDGRRYHVREMAAVMLALLGVCAPGIWLFNEPFDPAGRRLPVIYFSADWRWLPDAALKPRREVWGGLLVALVTLMAYARWVRRDSLAVRLALWGGLGGAVGFPLGQGLQAFAAWNRDALQSGLLRDVFPLINWWNLMETTFGFVLGGTLGLGLWLNRHRVFTHHADDARGPADLGPDEATLPPMVAGLLLALHVCLLVGVEFFAVPWVDAVYDFGLVLVTIPIVAVAGSRWWSYWMILPLVVLPIAGKTVVAVLKQASATTPAFAWTVYFALPLGAAAVAGMRFAGSRFKGRPAQDFLRPTLLLLTWLFFGLNYVVFQFPWPWAEWTIRTPNALVFLACAASLTWCAAGRRRPSVKPENRPVRRA